VDVCYGVADAVAPQHAAGLGYMRHTFGAFGSSSDVFGVVPLATLDVTKQGASRVSRDLAAVCGVGERCLG
jgi:hypothetical protein